MLKYIYETEHKEDFNEVVLDFSIDETLDNGYMISDSLGADIFLDINSIKEEVEKLIGLLEGKVESYGGGGNVNVIKSDRQYTTLEDIFTDEDEEEMVCRIETVEFLKIVLIWARENFQYKAQRGVMPEVEADSALNWIDQTKSYINTMENF
ncbi:hypothetical protein [Paenibacillus tarimensis]|uniref:hypothetical protein n=1 Tax=Paenibacillus tarimensis TaxID=416012 RepID=UPI001F1B87F3|nr:hypothetical protein [Paenibacillus tarimensis]MCF2945433.1 hypothetical protein [Paenibacillus tarimensis]